MLGKRQRDEVGSALHHFCYKYEHICSHPRQAGLVSPFLGEVVPEETGKAGTPRTDTTPAAPEGLVQEKERQLASGLSLSL